MNNPFRLLHTPQQETPNAFQWAGQLYQIAPTIRVLVIRSNLMLLFGFPRLSVLELRAYRKIDERTKKRSAVLNGAC